MMDYATPGESSSTSSSDLGPTNRDKKSICTGFVAGRSIPNLQHQSAAMLQHSVSSLSQFSCRGSSQC